MLKKHSRDKKNNLLQCKTQKKNLKKFIGKKKSFLDKNKEKFSKEVS